MKKYPDKYYYSNYRKIYGISMPDKLKENVEKLVILTVPFKMQDTSRFQTPEELDKSQEKEKNKDDSYQI